MHLCKYIFIITFIYIIQFTIFLSWFQLFCCIISITYTFNFLFWSAFLLSGDFADFWVVFRSAFFLLGDFADFSAGFWSAFFPSGDFADFLVDRWACGRYEETPCRVSGRQGVLIFVLLTCLVYSFSLQCNELFERPDAEYEFADYVFFGYAADGFVSGVY